VSGRGERGGDGRHRRHHDYSQRRHAGGLTAHMSTTPRTINATPESLTSVRSTPGGKRRSATAESCAATQPSPRLPNSRVSNTSRSRSWPSACGRSLVSAQHSNAIAHLSNSGHRCLVPATPRTHRCAAAHVSGTSGPAYKLISHPSLSLVVAATGLNLLCLTLPSECLLSVRRGASAWTRAWQNLQGCTGMVAMVACATGT